MEELLDLDIRNAIRKCAIEVIAMEATCVEWGASGVISIEIAEEAITNMVKMILKSRAL